MKRLIVAALVLAASLSPVARAGDARVASPEEKARQELFAQFAAARAARDYPSADLLATRLVTRKLSTTLDELADYWIFERGDCRTDYMPADLEHFLKYNDLLAGGLAVCEAAKFPAEAKSQSRIHMSALLDRFADGMAHPAGLYDAFARQATINERALELLAEYHLDDPRFNREGESALIAQIRAGRVDNVRLLLGKGYDANLVVSRVWPTSDPYADANPPSHPQPILPLQATVDSLATQREHALEIAGLLLAHGANPNKLKWYPHYLATPPADPALQARMDRLLVQAAAGKDAVSAEYRGLLFEHAEDSVETYLRFEIGNGSAERVSIPAWKSKGLYLMNGLNGWSRLESRVLGGEKWNIPILIEDGWSPSTTLEIPPGESREILMSVGIFQMSQAPEGTRYRLWLNNSPLVIYSDPFDLHGNELPFQQRLLKSKRDWYIEQRNAKR